MEASNRRSYGVSFILVDTAIIVKERLNHTQCLTIQPPMLKHSQGQVPGYIPQQTGYYVTDSWKYKQPSLSDCESCKYCGETELHSGRNSNPQINP